MEKKFLKNITDFIFTADEPAPADVIFIPGNRYPQMAEAAAKLYRKGFAKWLIPSGHYSILKDRFEGPVLEKERYDGNYETEADFLMDVLMKNGVPRKNILPENRALYTYENALFSKEILDGRGINVKQALLCCHAYHARRCKMYYELVFPEAELLICPVDTGINAENWYKSDEGAQIVLGEVERCGAQFKMMWEDLKKERHCSK